MNFEQANAMPLRDILNAIGIQPSAEKNNDLYFLAPWRNEKTASLHVSVNKNVWYDHGEGVGGNASKLIRIYLERSGNSHSDCDILRWFEIMLVHAPISRLQPSPVIEKCVSPFTIKTIKAIGSIPLIQYVESRGICVDVARQILQEVKIHNRNTGKQFVALALKNEDDGYELRNKHFKSSISPKTITFIRGTKDKPDCISVFEGMMDYLSIITRQKGKAFEGDTIILNSTSKVKTALAFIKNYGYKNVYTWLDNDPAGYSATQSIAAFVKAEEGITHQAMNGIYKDYNDVNAWHVAKPSV